MGIVAVRHVMLDTEEDKKKTPMRLGDSGDPGVGMVGCEWMGLREKPRVHL